MPYALCIGAPAQIKSANVFSVALNFRTPSHRKNAVTAMLMLKET